MRGCLFAGDTEEVEEELLSDFILFSDSVLLVVLVLEVSEVWNGFRGGFVEGGSFPEDDLNVAPEFVALLELLDELPPGLAEETGPSSGLRKKSIKSLKILKLGSTINSIKLI